MQVSTHAWTLVDLELVLGPSIDHGDRLEITTGLGSPTAFSHAAPYTFECGCLAVGLTPYLMLRACSRNHADLKSAV
ncbi:MAG TPA: hypothetical protein VII69_04040 [Candidatus Eremiobacteraceae bacterium]